MAPKIVVGVVGGTDGTDVFDTSVPLKTLENSGFIDYRTDGTDVIFLKYKI